LLEHGSEASRKVDSASWVPVAKETVCVIVLFLKGLECNFVLFFPTHSKLYQGECRIVFMQSMHGNSLEGRLVSAAAESVYAVCTTM
jgi:hypothetical protein